MGRGHGSTGTSSWRTGNGDVTMRGYSRSLAKAIGAKEAEIRNNRTESLYTYDRNGNLLYQAQGNQYAVDVDESRIPKGSVVTHNHPHDHSLSQGDVANAVAMDLAEIRAVGPKYTYSLKRPSGGWGVSAETANETYNRTINRIMAANSRHSHSMQGEARDRSIRRSHAIQQHVTMKAIAKLYGWEYTKSRTK